MAVACLAAWGAVSVVVAWAAGRFVRIGMIELQPDRETPP